MCECLRFPEPSLLDVIKCHLSPLIVSCVFYHLPVNFIKYHKLLGRQTDRYHKCQHGICIWHCSYIVLISELLAATYAICWPNWERIMKLHENIIYYYTSLSLSLLCSTSPTLPPPSFPSCSSRSPKFKPIPAPADLYPPNHFLPHPSPFSTTALVYILHPHEMIIDEFMRLRKSSGMNLIGLSPGHQYS